MTPAEEFTDRVAEQVRYWVNHTLSGGEPEKVNSAQAPIALGELLAKLSPEQAATVKNAIAYCAQGTAFSIMVGLDGDSGMADDFEVSIKSTSSGKSIRGELHDELVGRFMEHNEWVK